MANDYFALKGASTLPGMGVPHTTVLFCPKSYVDLLSAMTNIYVYCIHNQQTKSCLRYSDKWLSYARVRNYLVKQIARHILRLMILQRLGRNLMD